MNSWMIKFSKGHFIGLLISTKANVRMRAKSTWNAQRYGGAQGFLKRFKVLGKFILDPQISFFFFFFYVHFFFLASFITYSLCKKVHIFKGVLFSLYRAMAMVKKGDNLHHFYG